ncbi:myb-like protein D [Armigeres subalbatus]|uniref:myb-like protein D n=1 Tax=Armigeres subalbatus TaxID=124917 RepID=UPI002ED34081
MNELKLLSSTVNALKSDLTPTVSTPNLMDELSSEPVIHPELTRNDLDEASAENDTTTWRVMGPNKVLCSEYVELKRAQEQKAMWRKNKNSNNTNNNKYKNNNNFNNQNKNSNFNINRRYNNNNFNNKNNNTSNNNFINKRHNNNDISRKMVNISRNNNFNGNNDNNYNHNRMNHNDRNGFMNRNKCGNNSNKNVNHNAHNHNHNLPPESTLLGAANTVSSVVRRLSQRRARRSFIDSVQRVASRHLDQSRRLATPPSSRVDQATNPPSSYQAVVDNQLTFCCERSPSSSRKTPVSTPVVPRSPSELPSSMPALRHSSGVSCY